MDKNRFSSQNTRPLEHFTGEKTNLAKNPKYVSVLKKHQAYFSDWCKSSGDDFETFLKK
jgi:hypothetical protein